jgi:hypothetical protein
LLVGIAGKNLAPGVSVSVSERCEQRALGLQRAAPNRELARQSKIELQKEINNRRGKSR